MADDTPADPLEALTAFLYIVPVGLMQFGMDGAVTLANPLVAQLLMPLTPGASLADAYTALAPLVPDLARRVHAFTAPSGIVVNHERCAVTLNGKPAVLSLTVHRNHGGVNLVVLEDVTQQVEQERLLAEDRQRFRAIFDNVRDYAIYTVDLQGRVEEWNQSLQRIGGWLPEDVAGKPLQLFFPPDDPNPVCVLDLLADAIRIGSVETEGWRVRRDGSRYWANAVLTVLPDGTGAARGFVVVSRDMTERKRAEDELRRLATTDPLTGAFNRRHGQVSLAAAFAHAPNGAGRPGVLMLDIDHFKAINDRFGHDAGDVALCLAVETCRTVLAGTAAVVRWGGEEFLILLPHTDSQAALEAAEQLRVAISLVSFPAGSTRGQMTVSIGVAVSDGGNPESLVRRADTALYQAKRGGRNRVVLAP